MKKIILILVLFLPFFARATTCRPCQEVNSLAEEWAAVATLAQNDEASNRSSRIMKELRTINQRDLKKNALDPEVIHAIVATLGIIYLHDDDPLDDELTYLKPALKNKAFRRLFDQEVSQLPNEQKEKLLVGIDYIDHPTDEDLHGD